MQDNEFETRLRRVTSSRSPVRFGTILAATFFLGFGLWASTAPLSSAVVARGWVVKEGRSQKLSHAHGGVVSEILVKEGDQVARGDLLARIENPEKTADEAEDREKLATLVVQEKRLSAELAGRDFSAISQGERRGSSRLYRDQINLFVARRKLRENQSEELRSRKLSLEQELRGKQREIAALEKQRVLLDEQVKIQAHLHKKGAVSKAALRTARRQASQLETLYQEAQTERASLPHKIAEITSQQSRIISDFQASVLKELSSLRSDKAILEKRLDASTKLAARKELHAPVSGTIDKAHINTIGSAVSAFMPLFEIVPGNAPMLVEVEISPTDIEDVTVGQKARLSLSAFDHHEVPLMTGQVQFISPDSRRADDTGRPSYIARLSFDEGQGSVSKTLVPGMPVEVFMESSERTFLQILLDPLTKSIRRSFRD